MVEVCGFRYADGISKKTNKPFKGAFVYFTKDGASQGVTGFIADSLFMSDRVLQDRPLSVGMKLDIRYDNKGFVESVEFVK